MKYELTAKRLRLALNAAGLTQQELSDRTGIGKASISQYINGSHAPSNFSSGKMALVLKVSPVWLMGYDVPMLDLIEKEYSAATGQSDAEILLKISRLNERDKAIIMQMLDSMISSYE